MFLFFKQKTAFEMLISDWSSDVCSSDLLRSAGRSSDSGIESGWTDGSRTAAPGECRLAGTRRAPRIARFQFAAAGAWRTAPAAIVRVGRVRERITNDGHRRCGQGARGATGEFGRASCRDRAWPYGWILVVAVSLKTKQKYRM